MVGIVLYSSSSSSSAASSAPASPVGGTPCPSDRRPLVLAAVVIALVAVLVLVARLLARRTGRQRRPVPVISTGRRRRRPAPADEPRARPAERRAQHGRQRRAEPGAGRADRRPRLHPERPVRPVLPRRPGRLLRRGRRSTSTFQNKIDPDLVTLVGQGSIDVGLADGTSVIPAVSQGIPIKYVATIYGQFPSIVFAKASTGIRTAADLAGKKVGIPGRFGSSWIMLQALLADADLTPDDVEIVEYPDFGQGAAVDPGRGRRRDRVRQQRAGPAGADRGGGHDPARRRHRAAAGQRADRRAPRRSRRSPTPSPGSSPRPCARWRRSPRTREVGLDAAITAVPELGSAREVQAAILDATIEVWKGPAQEARGLGAIEPADWEQSIAYLETLGSRAEPGHGRRRHRDRPAAGAGLTAVLGGVRPTAARRSWWLREALAAEAAAAPHLAAAAPPLRGTTTADVVIVGGGYTGLWTALRADGAGAGAPGSCCSRPTSAAAGRPGATAGSSRTGGTSSRRSSTGTASPGADRGRRGDGGGRRRGRRVLCRERRGRLVHEGRLALGERRAGPGRRLDAGRRPRCASTAWATASCR